MLWIVILLPVMAGAAYALYRFGLVMLVLLGRDKDWLLLPYIIYDGDDPIDVYRIFTQELPLYEAIKWFAALLCLLGITLGVLVEGSLGVLALMGLLILIIGILMRELRWPLVHGLPVWYNRARQQLTLPDWYHLMRRWQALPVGTRRGLNASDHSFELWSDLVLLSSRYPERATKRKRGGRRLKMLDTILIWSDIVPAADNPANEDESESDMRTNQQ